MGFVRLIITLILFILLGAAVYLLYLNWPAEAIEYTYERPTVDNFDDTIEYGTSKQFYDNMRFSDRKIMYSFEQACDSDKKENIVKALEILESNTIISFVEDYDNSQLQVFCSEIAPDVDDVGYFVAGEGGPTEVINTTLYGVILSAKISFFREEKCNSPNIALHELLHALGFDHNNNPESILYPTLNCDQSIDQSVIDDINLIYSTDSAADLKIVNLDVSKSGRYINFNIEVVNQGLTDAKNVNLTMYDGGQLIQEFSLEDINIGTKKFLEVENLKGKRTSDKISFIVDESNRVKEIFEGNNRAEVILS